MGEYDELSRKRVELVEFKTPLNIEDMIGKEVIGRPRFSSFGAKGKLLLENEKIYFEYEEENVQNAPGQHLVIYYEDFVLGGGMIKY